MRVLASSLALLCFGVVTTGCSADFDGVLDAVDQGSVGSPDYAAAQTVYETACSPCHQGSGCSGNTCFVSNYAEATKSSAVCDGITVAACTVERIEDGSMPLNTSTVGSEDLAILKAWVAAGSPQ